jgi:peptide/nickel transport system permease protein
VAVRLPLAKDLSIAVGWQKGMLVAGLVITAFFLLVAIFAPVIAPYGFSQIKDANGVAFPTQSAPGAGHIWGTTVGGFDVFSRTVWGTRTAVIAIVIAVLLSIFAGVLLGLVSGYFGGWVDRVLVVIADAIYSFPSLLLAILMAIVISGGQSSLWGAFSPPGCQLRSSIFRSTSARFAPRSSASRNRPTWNRPRWSEPRLGAS